MRSARCPIRSIKVLSARCLRSMTSRSLITRRRLRTITTSSAVWRVHVTGMVDLANEIVKLYPLLDRDLPLVSGVLVHDLGKLTELSGPVMTEYAGRQADRAYLDHAGKDYGNCREAGFEKSEEAILLRHAVLSHHGRWNMARRLCRWSRKRKCRI